MVSTKKFITDGTTKSFLSEFIIKSIQHARVYIYEYKADCADTGVCDTIGSHGYFIRQTDAPLSADLVTIDKYDLIDNRISFYNDYIPPAGLTLWIEVATNSTEFSDILSTPAAIRAESAADSAELSYQNTLLVETNIENIETNVTAVEANVTAIETNVKAIEQLMNDKNTLSVLDYGAVGDGITDDTVAIQNTIDAKVLLGGGTVSIPAGNFMISQIILPSEITIKGESQDSTTLSQIAGSNTDMVVSKDYDTADIYRAGMVDLRLNGNFFSGNWNDATNTYNNTSGGGVKVRGYGLIFKIGIYNIAGIGMLFEEPHLGENSSEKHITGILEVDGRDFGKEGIIIKGPNDWIINRAFIGRAGIQKRPEAETNVVTSDYYVGQRVDGIVFDGANIEVAGVIHVYANWAGAGFITRNTCRLTNGGIIISESNRAQVILSANTYGSANIDYRNLSLLHPNWTAVIPTYSGPDENWDGCTNNAVDLILNATCKRTITATTRVAGATGMVNNGSSNVNYIYSNSTAPTGDVEAGTLYSGKGLEIYGDNANIKTNIKRTNGNAIIIKGASNKIEATISDCIGGSSVIRDSISNSKRGNNIDLTIDGCATGFNSIGTPTSEILNLTYEYGTGGVAWIGDAPDQFNRSQTWNINGSIANIRTGSFYTQNINTRGLNYQGTELQTILDNKEDDLSNPTVDGYFLSSTISGVRSWVQPPIGDLTAITTHVKPDSDNKRLLGDSTHQWISVYTRNLSSGTSQLNLLVTNGNKCSIRDNSWGYEMATFRRYGNTFNVDSGDHLFKYDNLESFRISKFNTYATTYTSLGELAPAIKTKKLTGLTGAAQGDTTLIAHGLVGAKIISFTAKVEHITGGGVQANVGIANYEFTCYHTSTNFVVTTKTGSSGSILSKNIIIYVTYEQ